MPITDYSIIDMKLAYIAGFFDGEGCITVTTNKDYNYNKCYPNLMIQATNTKKKVLQFIADAFPEGHVYDTPTNPKRNRQTLPCYIWRCGGMKAAKILEKLLPYLIVKKPQAILAIEMAYNPPELRIKFAHKISELNHGKGDDE